MYEAVLINLADIVQLLTVLFTLLGFLPQLLTLYGTKSSKGISRHAWILWVLGSGMALFYAIVHYWIEGCCLPLVITTTFNCAFTVITLILIILYRDSAFRARPRPHEQPQSHRYLEERLG
jgi:uncharacterized protein with PQ loop repeat